jgi:hypothetical protein
MAKFAVALLLFCMSARHLNAQREIEVLIPEAFSDLFPLLTIRKFGLDNLNNKRPPCVGRIDFGLKLLANVVGYSV